MSKLRDLSSEDHLHLVSVLPVPSEPPLSIKAVILRAHRDSSSCRRSSREGLSRDSPAQHRGRVSTDSSVVDHPLPVSTDREVHRHTAGLRTVNIPGTAISRDSMLLPDNSSRKAAVSS